MSIRKGNVILAGIQTAQTKSFGSFALSVNQTANISPNNIVNFDLSEGNMTLSNGLITLPANKTFFINFSTRCNFTDGTGAVAFDLFNYTDNQLLKPNASFPSVTMLKYSTSGAYIPSDSPTMQVLIKTTQNINMGIRINSAIVLTSILSAYTMLSIYET